MVRRWVAVAAAACASACGARASAPPKATADATVAAAPARPARVQRMIDGLRRIAADLEVGAVTPERAFDRVAALEVDVGPPTIVLPPGRRRVRS
jgi:hypothetical protein